MLDNKQVNTITNNPYNSNEFCKYLIFLSIVCDILFQPKMLSFLQMEHLSNNEILFFELRNIAMSLCLKAYRLEKPC